jgi:hypothetical protein
MSANDKPEPAPGAIRRKLGDDDHDLLTFSEAGERLQVEIAAAAQRVSELEAVGSAAKLESALSRLDALRSAAQRNSAQSINDENFERFFGYPGRAKQNLPGPTR